MRKLGFICFWMIIVLAGTVSMGTIALADDEKKSQQEAKETDDEDTPQTDTEKSKKKELELKACGESEVNFSAKTDKKQHPRAEPQADKAIVYVIRPTSMGNKVQSKLALDGKWLGSNRGNNYFYFTADPGDHYFCSKAENRFSAFRREASCSANSGCAGRTTVTIPRRVSFPAWVSLRSCATPTKRPMIGMNSRFFSNTVRTGRPDSASPRTAPSGSSRMVPWKRLAGRSIVMPNGASKFCQGRI